MKKKTIKTMLTTLLTLSIISFPVNVFSYEGDTFSVNNVETWVQWRYPGLSDELIRPGGDTVSLSACGYFALASAVLKEGSFDKEFNPEKMIDLAKEYEMWNNYWGHFDFQRIEELNIGLKLPDINEFGGAIRNNDYYYWSISGNWSDKQETIRELWRAGYYVILCVTNEETDGHYVFVDYVDKDGRIRITDSSRKGTWLDEAYHGGFNYMIVLESVNGIKSNEQESVYKDFDENSREFNKEIFNKKTQKQLDKIKPIQASKILKINNILE